MKRSLLLLIAFIAVVVMAGSAFAQVLGNVEDQPIQPPTASWSGTTDILWIASNFSSTGLEIYPKRVGILAYCADLYHNEGDIGLQPGGRRKFDYLGQYGAQNIVDYFAYDDTIDRLRDAQIIDGDLVLPTGTQLIQNFDIVIAYTDNKCGQPIPVNIANSAAKALTDFIAVPGKKLILTGFAFSNSIGFGNGIFGAGLSPLTKGGPGLAPCRRADAQNPDGSPGTPCAIGVCPTTNLRTGNPCTQAGAPPECRDDLTNEVCTAFQPLPGGPNTAAVDFACSELLNNVNGPTSSSWATALTQANVGRGATLCFNYDGVGAGIPFVAINAARNIIAINAFPPDRDDIVKFWYGCMLGNALQYFSGDTQRCAGMTDRLNCRAHPVP